MATRVSLARHRALVTVIPCHKCPCELVISNVKNMFGCIPLGGSEYCLKQEACRKHLSSLSLDQSQSHSRSSEALKNAVHTKLITLHDSRVEEGFLKRFAQVLLNG